MPSTKAKSIKHLPEDDLFSSSVMGRIYNLEKRKTIFLVLEYLFFISIFFLLFLMTLLTFVAIIRESEILSLLELFTEDLDTIKRYFADTLNTIYIETPKEHLLLLILFVTLTTLSIVLFKRRLPIIRHKFHSINKYKNKYHN